MRDNFTKLKTNLQKKRLTSRNFYDISECFHTTILNEEFLVYDYGIRDIERVVVFKTVDFLSGLSNRDCILLDATFKNTPNLFSRPY